jgi:hypothetical protein
LVLNKVARDQLSAPEYVELAYDRDINTIRMISSTMEDGIPLIKTRVPASDFFAQYEIAAEGKYSAKYKQDEGALYISL